MIARKFLMIVMVIAAINCFATVVVNNWLSAKSPPCQDYRMSSFCTGTISGVGMGFDAPGSIVITKVSDMPEPVAPLINVNPYLSDANICDLN